MPGPISRLNLSIGTDWLAKTAENAVQSALGRYGGPCPEAHADILRDYLMADERGREALFLAVAWRALGEDGVTRTPNPNPADKGAVASAPRPDPGTSQRRRSPQSGS